MVRKLLLLLAVLVLIAIGLIYLGIISWSGGSQVEVRPVDVSLENRDVNVQLPVPVIQPGGQNAAQAGQPATGPLPAPQPAPDQPTPAQPQPAPQPQQ